MTTTASTTMTMSINMTMTILAILTLALGDAGGMRGGRTGGRGAAAPIPVRTARVEWARRAAPIRVVGTLAGKEEIKLSFKVGGIVERVFVEEGATVAAGQRLATLKRREVDSAVIQTSRGFEKAERDLSRIKDLYQRPGRHAGAAAERHHCRGRGARGPHRRLLQPGARHHPGAGSRQGAGPTGRER